MKKIEGEIKQYVTYILKRDDNSWILWGDGQGIHEQLGTKTTPELVETYIQELQNQMKLAQEYLGEINE